VTAVFTLTITYLDGVVQEVEGDQYAVAVWERWAAKQGLKNDPRAPEALAMTQLRVMAWAAVQRTGSVKQSFDVWDGLVRQVEAGSPEPVDPTRPAMSAG
jgi:hypothetical protein